MRYERSIRTLAVLAIVLSALLAMAVNSSNAAGEIVPAPNFTATDHTGRTFSLSDYAGDAVILHITQLEIPVCQECEMHMREQMAELARLSEDGETDVRIITLNIRKNPYSKAGWELAREWYGIEVTWNWVEEFEPFPSAGLYQKYWEVKNSFANPSLIMIDAEQNVVGVYHVYCIGTGVLDGLQTAESLSEDVKEIRTGEWGEFRGSVSKGITLAGMFMLGIVTSLSPCSIALLIVMISYIGSRSGNAEPAVARKRGLGMGVMFTLGMTLMFFLIGLLVAYVGLFIEMSAMFYLVAGIILGILGINAIKPLNIMDRFKRLLRNGEIGHSPAVRRTKREPPLWIQDIRKAMFHKFRRFHHRFGIRHERRHRRVSRAKVDSKGSIVERIGGKSEMLGAFLLGLLFTIGWAPCAMTLVFPVIVLMLSQQFSILTGGIMLAVFGLGHGIVIVPVCAATGDVKGRMGNKLVNAGKWVQPVFGIIIIAMGVIFAARYWGLNLW